MKRFTGFKILLILAFIGVIIGSAQALSVTSVSSSCAGGQELTNGITNIGRAPCQIGIGFDQIGGGGPGFGGVGIPGATYSVWYNGIVNAIVIDVLEPMDFDTTYTINVPEGALKYEVLTSPFWVYSEPFTLQFTTIPRSLSVLSYWPPDGASNLQRTDPLQNGITVQFNDDIRLQGPDWNNIRLTTANGNSVPISVSYGSPESLYIVPPVLDFDMAYTLTIPMDAIESPNGYNRMPADFSIQFRTEPRSLKVLSISPTDGATNVPISTGSISVVFNDYIGLQGPDWNNIRLTQENGDSVSITKTYVNPGTILRITYPSLNPNAKYILTIPMDAIESPNGYDRLPNDFVSSFSTVSLPPASCDFSKLPGSEKCFGGIGVQCDGILGILTFNKDETTCNVSGYMSGGSILHDQCCINSGNNGVNCAHPAKKH